MGKVRTWFKLLLSWQRLCFSEEMEKNSGRIVQRIQRARYVEFWWGLEQSKKQVNDASGYTVSDLTNHTVFFGHHYE